jgi:hypothetical protein
LEEEIAKDVISIWMPCVKNGEVALDCKIDKKKRKMDALTAEQCEIVNNAA